MCFEKKENGMGLEGGGQPGPGGVLGKALIRAAAAVGLKQAEAAAVGGASAASGSRTFSAGRGVDPDSAEGRLALLFVRVFRSIDAPAGGDRAHARLCRAGEYRHAAGSERRR